MRHISKLNTVLALALSAAMIIPCTAFAASPEFARTEEEWASLQDNVLEYGEIEDLVHEYNATIQKNQLELNKFRQDYGMTNDEWSKRYREIADDLEYEIDYPDIDDSSYATQMTTIINNEMQIKSLRETADDALEDYEVYYLTYMQQEKQTAKQAQDYLVEYFAKQVTLQSDLKNRELLEENYQDASARVSLGTATRTEILLAEQNLQLNTEAIENDYADIAEAKENLLVLLGWEYNADPVIMPLPELDFTHIAAMNPDVDRYEAMENNYTLRINQQKYDNARSQDNKETLEKSITENQQMIGASLSSLYNTVLSSQMAYELAQSEYALEQNNLTSAQRQYSNGSISRMELLTQQNAAEMKQIDMWSAYLDLFQAVQDYDWAVKGLASA